MKKPWEQDRERNNTVITNATENRWGVIARESELNYKIQTEQDVLIEKLTDRVTSLEEDMKFALSHIKILEVDRQIEVISPSWGEENDMEVTEAITQLEIIATNMVGRLCEIPNEDERQIELLNKQIEALDMGIDALKKLGE